MIYKATVLESMEMLQKGYNIAIVILKEPTWEITHNTI